MVQKWWWLKRDWRRAGRPFSTLTPSLLVSERRYAEFAGQYGIIECCTEEGSYYLLAIRRIRLNLPTFLELESCSQPLLQPFKDSSRRSARFCCLSSPSSFSPFLRCSSLFPQCFASRLFAEVIHGEENQDCGIMRGAYSSTRARSVRWAQWLSC